MVAFNAAKEYYVPEIYIYVNGGKSPILPFIVGSSNCVLYEENKYILYVLPSTHIHYYPPLYYTIIHYHTI